MTYFNHMIPNFFHISFAGSSCCGKTTSYDFVRYKVIKSFEDEIRAGKLVFLFETEAAEKVYSEDKMLGRKKQTEVCSFR